jgi:hypothetical protein
MEVSGQLRADTAVLLLKEPPVPIESEAGWTPEAVWTLWRREKSLPLPETDITKFLITSWHFLSFGSKYTPQHPVLKYPLSVFFPQGERLHFTLAYCF